MNYEKLTLGSIGVCVFLGCLYKLREIHLKSKCNKLIDLEVDLEANHDKE
jgi:hypothetical protein